MIKPAPNATPSSADRPQSLRDLVDDAPNSCIEAEAADHQHDAGLDRPENAAERRADGPVNRSGLHRD